MDAKVMKEMFSSKNNSCRIEVQSVSVHYSRMYTVTFSFDPYFVTVKFGQDKYGIAVNGQTEVYNLEGLEDHDIILFQMSWDENTLQFNIGHEYSAMVYFTAFG